MYFLSNPIQGTFFVLRQCRGVSDFSSLFWVRNWELVDPERKRTHDRWRVVMKAPGDGMQQVLEKGREYGSILASRHWVCTVMLNSDQELKSLCALGCVGGTGFSLCQKVRNPWGKRLAA